MWWTTLGSSSLDSDFFHYTKLKLSLQNRVGWPHFSFCVLLPSPIWFPLEACPKTFIIGARRWTFIYLESEGVWHCYHGHCCWGRLGRNLSQLAVSLLLWRQMCWALSQGCFFPGMMLLGKHRAQSLGEHPFLISAALSTCLYLISKSGPVWEETSMVSAFDPAP